ncbi:MAG: HEAT repeat domain-containing protein [Candidatus Aminicenantes bacterium]|nr:MAG: HEAT repeat domain-containing protein [Candidatus Aminicenantes bacterium]
MTELDNIIFLFASTLWRNDWMGARSGIFSLFQENLLPIVSIVLIFLAILLIILFLIYLGAMSVHARRKIYVDFNAVKWEAVVKLILDREDFRPKEHVSRKDRKYFRDIIISEYLKHDASGKNRLRLAYKQLGFFEDDIAQLKKPSWWKKIQAIGRLEEMGLREAEDNVFSLLKDSRHEVRIAALRMLSSMGSKKLFGILPELFAEESRWEYRNMVNVLYNAGIPANDLMPLAVSQERDLRKAAAILLGKQGSEEAIPILKDLVNDNDKDVRREAVRSLGLIGSSDAMPILIEKINDSNHQVQGAVARALGDLSKWKDLDVAFFLEWLANVPDFGVRFEAISNLCRLGEEGKKIIKELKHKYPEIAQEFLFEKENVDHNI